MRMVGVSMEDVSDWREPAPTGRCSQFFAALDRRATLVDLVRPEVSSAARYLNLARSFRPDRAAWRSRSSSNRRYVARLNATLARELERVDGPYDLIVQMQTLCSPRSASRQTPYVIYTDSTMALVWRDYARFSGWTERTARRWQEFEADLCVHAESVYTFSEWVRGSMIDDYGCARNRVTTIGAGANQRLASLDQKDYSRPIALFVGSDFERKGGASLLAAWPSVRRRLPDAELIIAGPTRDPRTTSERGISYLGMVSRDTLTKLYCAARAFVLPSVFEPWGHVLVEAMAHGLPCIGTDCCAMPELIDDGVSGRLVARSDPQQLAAALIEVLGDQERAREMGRVGYGRVELDFTWDRVLDRFMDSLPAR